MAELKKKKLKSQKCHIGYMLSDMLSSIYEYILSCSKCAAVYIFSVILGALLFLQVILYTIPHHVHIFLG